MLSIPSILGDPEKMQRKVAFETREVTCSKGHRSHRDLQSPALAPHTHSTTAKVQGRKDDFILNIGVPALREDRADEEVDQKISVIKSFGFEGCFR